MLLGGRLPLTISGSEQVHTLQANMPKSHSCTAAQERNDYDHQIRQRQRWTEFRLLGYQIENDWVLLRLGRRVGAYGR